MWVTETPQAVDLGEPNKTTRIQCTTYRILRDTALAREIKVVHNFKCQICGDTLELADGTLYAEAHHVKPLGAPHNGPDADDNIICVCPNHHVLLDYGAISLDSAQIQSCATHQIENIYIEYHNTNIFKKVVIASHLTS